MFFNRVSGQLWPVPANQESSLKYVSLFIYHLLQFWKCLRDETLKPDRARDGTRFNMQQFRKLFNSTRIPKKGKNHILFLKPFKYISSLKTPTIFINISLSYSGWYLAGF
jgi:hypothetical protein